MRVTSASPPARLPLMSDPRSNEGDGFAALSYILAGLLLYGLLGWLGDKCFGTGFLLPIGLIAGLGLGVYLVIKRYGASALPGADNGKE